MRKLDKKTLDKMGIALVKANAISVREVERIAAKPDLFDSLLAQVKATTVRSNKTKPGYTGRVLAGSVAGIALAVAAAFAISVLRSVPVDVAVEQHREPLTVSTPKVSAISDNVVEAGFLRSENRGKAERISAKPEVRSIPSKRSKAQQIRYEGDFHALSYAGDPNETERGGRIVRVDVPRSTLFAMDIDVPLENETETIKADLLIGSDGVTRGIRVVR